MASKREAVDEAFPGFRPLLEAAEEAAYTALYELMLRAEAGGDDFQWAVFDELQKQERGYLNHLLHEAQITGPRNNLLTMGDLMEALARYAPER